MADASESIHSTLCLRTGVQPPAGRGQYGARGQGYTNAYQSNPPYQSNPQSQSNPSGRGRGRGRGRFQQGRDKCSLCVDYGQPYAVGHGPWSCSLYPTPAERRERLSRQNRCTACAQTVHAGECQTNIECKTHKAKHHRWTCDPQGHPGKQEPSSR